MILARLRESQLLPRCRTAAVRAEREGRCRFGKQRGDRVPPSRAGVCVVLPTWSARVQSHRQGCGDGPGVHIAYTQLSSLIVGVATVANLLKYCF